MENESEGDTDAVKKYLQDHNDLATYLDRTYKKGIDWDGQKALGNNPVQPWQNFVDSQGKLQRTDKLSDNDLLAYAKAMGYNDLDDLNQTLWDAGLRIHPGQVHTEDDTYFATPEVIKNRKGFVNAQGNTLTIKASDLKPIAKQHQKYLAQQAKNAALNSRQSNAWGQLGQRLGLQGKFYDKMLWAGYHYVPAKGYYMNNQGNKIFLKKGVVYSNSGNSAKALTWGQLKSMLHLNSK